MRRTLFLSAAFLMAIAGSPSWALDPPGVPVVPGDLLPPFSGEYLTGRTATLPADATGKVALVMMGFTYDSRHAVERYGQELRAAFGSEPGLTFYEVPVIGGMGRMAKWFINSGMRRGTPKGLHENVITVYGGAGRLKALVGFSKSAEHDAYLTLIDQTGRVRWTYHGPWAQAAFETLRAHVASVLALTDGM